MKRRTRAWLDALERRVTALESARPLPFARRARPMPPTVCCVFSNTEPLGLTPDALLAVLQEYVDRHVGRAWGVACTLVRADKPDPGEWPLFFTDDADQAGALGYHEYDATPIGHVFVRTAKRDGDTPSGVAAHELAELLADPACDRVVQTPRGRLVGLEVADAVEGPTFDVRGTPVANFMHPAWFGRPNPPGVTGYDHLGQCTRPFEILSTGYMPFWDGWGWGQLFGSQMGRERFAAADRRLRRSHRRGRRPAAERAPEGGPVVA